MASIPDPFETYAQTGAEIFSILSPLGTLTPSPALSRTAALGSPPPGDVNLDDESTSTSSEENTTDSAAIDDKIDVSSSTQEPRLRTVLSSITDGDEGNEAEVDKGALEVDESALEALSISQNKTDGSDFSSEAAIDQGDQGEVSADVKVENGERPLFGQASDGSLRSGWCSTS